MPAHTLWVGGTSALARSYFEEVHPAHGAPLITVAAPAPPAAWELPAGVAFVELDLTSESSIRSLFSRLPHAVDTLVLSVRVSLVWATPQQHEELVQHLGLLLRAAAAGGCTSVLHVSSIAVADHVTPQRLVREDDPPPPLAQIRSPYDRFKLRSEQIVDDVCADERGRIRVWTHLRLSGIFSNDPACIQCTAIRRQALLTVAQRAAIDFNSSRNVSLAMARVLERQRRSAAAAAAAAADGGAAAAVDGAPPYLGRQLFYYTRSVASPTPYWHHVADYRRANGIWYGLFLPAWVGERLVVPLLRAALRAVPAGTWPLAGSLLYLLDVSSVEHNADNRRFRAAFPDLATEEESICEAFRRMRRRRDEAAARAAGSGPPFGRGASACVALCALAGLALSASGTPAVPLHVFLPPPPPPPPPPWWSVWGTSRT